MRAILILPLLPFVCGCGGGGAGPGANHPATGSVLVADKPAAGVVVKLLPTPAQPDAPTPSATTGADGRFALQTAGQPGAPKGKYVVILTWPPPRALGAPGPNQIDRFSGRYAGRDRPFMELEIGDGTGEIPAFRVQEAPALPRTPPRTKGKRS